MTVRRGHIYILADSRRFLMVDVCGPKFFRRVGTNVNKIENELGIGTTNKTPVR